jgi:hypothetical protein
MGLDGWKRLILAKQSSSGWSVRHAGCACCQKCSWRSRKRGHLDRQERQFLALRRIGLRFGRYSGDLNDLWEFNPSTQQWTWMGGSSRLPFPGNGLEGQPGVYGTLGVPAPGNIPGGRTNAVSWTDKSGNFWLFGGEGYATVGGLTGNVVFNDLWEFNPSTNEWAWMGGDNKTGNTDAGQSGVYGTLGIPASQNIPGGR